MKGLGIGRAVIPIGPHHPLQEKPALFNLLVEDETVVDADINLGYNHRGIEKLSERMPFDEAAFLVERICGASSVSHSLAYSNAVEDILGIEPPERSLYIRVVLAELERLSSHLFWLGLMGHFIGYDTLFALAVRYRQPLLDTLEFVTGSRVHSGMIKPGGVRKDIDDSDAQEILRTVSGLLLAADKLRKSAIGNPLIKMRLKGIGSLSMQDAVGYAAVGPVARASGVDIDARKNIPYAVYDKIKWNIIVSQEGDVFSKVSVRLFELYESIELIRECLKRLPKGPIDVKIKEVSSGEGIGIAEAPDGECLHYVRSDGSNSPLRHKIRSASFMNIPTVKAVVNGQQISDAVIILASIDPCYCCAERLAVVDRKKKVRTLDFQTLVKLSRGKMRK